MDSMAALALVDNYENEHEAARTAARNEIMSMTRTLMPQGLPDFVSVRNYPSIHQLRTDVGDANMHKVLMCMVKHFCDSVNVVRNMTEDQMIECADMLLHECDTFRLEDYQMMFALGKRGDLVKIMDRLDINVVTQMMDAYWQKRNEAGKREAERIEHEAMLQRQAEAKRRYESREVTVDIEHVVEETQTKAEEWRREYLLEKCQDADEEQAQRLQSQKENILRLYGDKLTAEQVDELASEMLNGRAALGTTSPLSFQKV